MKILHSKQDVLDYFDVKNEKQLNRKVYNITACRAWAELTTSLKEKSEKKELWSARYAKVDNIWTLISFFDKNKNPTSTPPSDVQDFFWPSWCDVSEWLNNKYPTHSDVTITESVSVTKVTLKDQFVIGSCVEGSDVEIGPVYVNLPCHIEEIEAAIIFVEEDAAVEWHNANFCYDDEE